MDLKLLEIIFNIQSEVETGAKKIGLVFWAISGIKNGFTAFC